jgi:hypothetical protein
MWAVTPQGLLKGTGTNTPTRPVADGAELTYTVGGRYPLSVHINKMNQVGRGRSCRTTSSAT